MLKGSALASSITVMDIIYTSKEIMSRTYTVLEIYFAAGVIYLVLSWVILFGFRQFERWINGYKYYKVA